MAAAILVIAVRVRLRNVPLERDEGEYAYAGQLLLDGVPPYAEVYSMKAPGIYAAYATVMALFGRSVAGIRLGLLAVNFLAASAVFLLGRRLAGMEAGAVAGVSYALMSLSASVLGLAAHATQFSTPFVVTGFVVLLESEMGARSGRVAAAGALLAIACTMRQHSLVFLVFGAAWLAVRSSRRIGALGAFGAGAAVPLAAMWLALFLAGVFPRYWFWNFAYAARYVTSASISEGVGSLGAHLATMWPLAGFAALGVAGLIFRRKDRFSPGFLVASFLAVTPGLFFRSHYFVQLLPAVALLAGIGAVAIHRRAGTTATWASVLAAGALFAGGESRYLFRESPTDVSRSVYPGCPFVESGEIADYVRNHTRPDERIAVLGSEPQIGFLSQRRVASGYIYMYGLMEEQPYNLTMQHELVAEIEAAQPGLIVWCNVRSSWLQQRGSPTFVLDWARGYLKEHYEPVWQRAIPPAGDIDWVAIYRRR